MIPPLLYIAACLGQIIGENFIRIWEFKKCLQWFRQAENSIKLRKVMSFRLKSFSIYWARR